MTYSYEIKLNGTVVEKFDCKRPETAYNRFNRYAKKRGYTENRYDSGSHGFMVWFNHSNVLALTYKGFKHN